VPWLGRVRAVDRRRVKFNTVGLAIIVISIGKRACQGVFPPVLLLHAGKCAGECSRIRSTLHPSTFNIGASTINGKRSSSKQTNDRKHNDHDGLPLFGNRGFVTRIFFHDLHAG
jgi:hypothetical protein